MGTALVGFIHEGITFFPHNCSNSMKYSRPGEGVAEYRREIITAASKLFPLPLSLFFPRDGKYPLVFSSDDTCGLRQARNPTPSRRLLRAPLSTTGSNSQWAEIRVAILPGRSSGLFPLNRKTFITCVFDLN